MAHHGPHNGRKRRLGDRYGSRALLGAVEPETGENRAVEELLALGLCGCVELRRLPKQREHLFQAVEYFCAGGLGIGHEPLGIGNLCADLGLALFQRIDRHGVGHVGINEFLLLSFERDQPPPLICDEPSPAFCRQMEVGSRPLAEQRNLFVGETHSLPLGEHCVFYLHHADVGQGALAFPGVAGEAEEVVVVTATTFRHAVADPSSAAVAGQGTLQGVAVSPGSVAGDASAAEYILYSLPGDLINDRVVVAVMDDAVEDHLALVVRVAQDPVQLSRGDRLADDLSCRA